MNLEEIKTLSELMLENGLTRIELEDGEKKILLERQPAMIAAAPAAAAIPAAAPAPADPQPAGEKPVDFNNMKEVKSPMVGMFYDSPSPEADPYVKVGSKVKKGDVLCVIEAMKLLNEITAETDGEIVDICATNGSIVEYGQTLFKIF